MFAPPYCTNPWVATLIPSFPNGASIDSILLACHLVCQYAQLYRSRNFFYGVVVGDASNVLGKNANAFAERALASTISGRELAMQHTAWPVYSSLLPPTMVETCLVGLISGNDRTKWHRFHAPFGATGYAQEWRACAQCCRQDSEEGCGIGHWRVIHQLPGITSCPVHLTPLQHRCSFCHSQLGGPKSIAMPAWPCQRCGSVKRDALRPNNSSGAKALSDLYVRLLNNENIPLSPAHRGELHQGLVGINPTHDVIDDYVHAVLTSFKVKSLREFGSFLGSEIHREDMFSAIIGGKACPPSLNLALSAFALGCEKPANLANAIVLHQQENQSNIVCTSPVESSGLSELYIKASDHGIPAAAILRWSQGAIVSALCSDFSLSTTTLRAFRSGLSTKQQAFLPLADKKERKKYHHLKDASREHVLDFHRNAIESRLASGSIGRAGLLKDCKSSYLWCLRNDKEWLDKASPKQLAASILDPEGWRSKHRKNVCAAIESGARLRRDLLKIASKSYQWCVKYDQDWLDKQLPQGNRWRKRT